VADLERLRSLVAEVERFRICDRNLTRAHERFRAELARGATPDPTTTAAYLRAVKKYFSEFEREACDHLRNVDRRLAHVNQVQFNLTAERGVTARRVEATRGIITLLTEFDGGV
jgi:hypothetical protein